MVQMFGDFERGIPPGEYDHLQYVVLVLLYIVLLWCMVDEK